MSGKTISAGTLNLRFMQNAERAKPGAQSQANTESTPPDESRWEVGQAVQDAWGASRPSTSVTYEASYLPFVYAPSSTAGDAPKLRGRRTWNKRGQESIAGAEPSIDPSDDAVVAAAAVAPPPADAPAPARQGKIGRPTSISGAGGAAHDARPARARAKPATGLVGGDLRRDGPPRFLKPAGVDDPADGGDVIGGDEGVPGGRKAKRVRDDRGRAAEGDEEKGRRKKRKSP